MTPAGRRAQAGRPLAGDGMLRWTQSFHPGFALTVDSAVTRRLRVRSRYGEPVRQMAAGQPVEVSFTGDRAPPRPRQRRWAAH
ncbi:hypothetical protein [Micromonospora sp. C95]|uniref:hypothetical protein n=1 Tax=Micromonospora sp. C95 TaxID=2824882 RepID=UPI001B361D88|nr:hypothetical protein [Micromonospora sp. C95]MBQ1026402.1 hypothetical protein [Micromonospora sp. C95]